MSEAILSAGSTEPPKVAGKYRLYGLRLIPSTQQVRLVLLSKNVPHELVNINPRSIPEWYKKIQPEGKLPALQMDDKLLVETQAIVEYIDDKFPDPPLLPVGCDNKAILADILKKLEPVARDTEQMFEKKDAKPSQEAKDLIATVIERLESAGTTFFVGNSPGLPDFMMWPWVQAGQVPSKLHGTEYVSDDMKDKLTPLINWMKAMSAVKAVQEVTVPVEEYLTYLK